MKNMNSNKNKKTGSDASLCESIWAISSSDSSTGDSGWANYFPKVAEESSVSFNEEFPDYG